MYDNGTFDSEFIEKNLYELIYLKNLSVLNWTEGKSIFHKEIKGEIYYGIKNEVDKKLNGAKKSISIDDLRKLILNKEVELHNKYFNSDTPSIANNDEKNQFMERHVMNTHRKLLSMEKPIISGYDVEYVFEADKNISALIENLKSISKNLHANLSDSSWARENYNFFSVPTRYKQDQDLFLRKSEQKEIEECPYCFQKNRIPKITSHKKPKCAKCGSFLRNYELISMLELINRLINVDKNVKAHDIQKCIDYASDEADSQLSRYFLGRDATDDEYDKIFSRVVMNVIERENRGIQFSRNFPLIVKHHKPSDAITIKLY